MKDQIQKLTDDRELLLSQFDETQEEFFG